jgi:hypothetical protein
VSVRAAIVGAAALGAVSLPVSLPAQMFVPVVVETARYARCAGDRDPGAARSFVLAAPGSRESKAAYDRLTDSEDACVRAGSLRMRTHWLRGALGEHLLEREPDRMRRLAGRQPVQRGPLEPVQAHLFGDAVALCVAGAEPVRALAVLATERATPEEREAVLALRNSIDACLPASGRQQLTVADLRSHLAVQLYHLAEDTRDGNGAS